MDYGAWMREGEDVLRAMPAPTPEEDAALSLELARENAQGAEDDALLCDWCSDLVLDGCIFVPYCSSECEQDATRETYASVHPRPEEVG